MSNKIVNVDLDFPVQLADRLLDKITLRRPTMKDLRVHPIKGQDDVAGEMRHFCALTGLKLDEPDQLDVCAYHQPQAPYATLRPHTGSGGTPDWDSEPGPPNPPRA